MKKRIAAAMLTSLLSATAARAVDSAPATTQPATPAKKMVFLLRTDGDSPTTQPSTITIQNDGDQLNAVSAALQAAFQGKTEKTAWMGVATSRAPLSLMKQMKLKSGVVVDEVIPNSPAAAAGLKAQDLIEKLDDQLLMNPAQLESLIRMHNPRDSIALTILHEGARSTVTAKLVEHDVLAVQGDGPQAVSISPPTVRTFAAAPANAAPSIQTDKKIITFDDSGGGPNGHGSSSFQSQFSDGTDQLTISGHDGHKTLVIKDAGGKELFNGPIDTPDQQTAIPKDLLPKFQQMQKMSSMTEKLPAP